MNTAMNTHAALVYRLQGLERQLMNETDDRIAVGIYKRIMIVQDLITDLK